MKLLLPFSILLLVSLLTFGQQVPVGSQWTFGAYYGGDMYGSDKESGFTKLEAVKDTVILGKTCSKLVWDRNLTCGPLGISYFYEENGKAYRYLPHAADFELYADYTVNVGDTLVRYDWHDADSVLLRVDSITTPAELKGLKKFHLTSLNVGINGIFSVLYENLGYADALGLNPEVTYIICDGSSAGNLRCFESPGGPSYKLTSGDCEAELYVAVSESVLNDEAFSLYPNPAYDKVNIIWPAYSLVEGYRVTLLDITGKVVFTGPLQQQINIDPFEPGVYQLIIEDSQHHRVFQNRLLIQ
ncbi:T9SS type A sorting domain-containing protein [bacterium SCSIO 12741]|nr:T9SS type A sorting domain-containing protein [bacterium SCSIO 12741]